jgi:hypothetical protein
VHRDLGRPALSVLRRDRQLGRADGVLAVAVVDHADVGTAGLQTAPGAGNYIDASAYGITWRRAREAALTLDELALELAPRPYDLRQAGISFWLASGVDPAECARRAGQSIQVLE